MLRHRTQALIIHPTAVPHRVAGQLRMSVEVKGDLENIP